MHGLLPVRSRSLPAFALGALLALGGASAVHAATWYVSPCGSDGWVGVQSTCVAPLGPKRTIQAAITTASAGDTVVVLPGTYAGSIDLLGKAITVRSSSGAAVTILDGNGSGPVVLCNSFEGPGTVLRGFTIQDGDAAQGGGLLAALASPTILECVFRDNHAAEGGAVALISASPTIADCSFEANKADGDGATHARGGAIRILAGAPTITRCAFDTNYALVGGGAVHLSDGAAPVFEDCAFTGNLNATVIDPPGDIASGAVVSLAGAPTFVSCVFDANRTASRGAVGIAGGTASFHACTFTGNTQGQVAPPPSAGGAMFIRDGAFVTLLGCEFDENHSLNEGGAVHVLQSTLTATLCGFHGNVAHDSRGGAIIASEADITLTACVLSGNSAIDGGAYSSWHGTLNMDGCVVSGNHAPGGLGGGLQIWGTIASIDGCTFASNDAEIGGGLMFDGFTELTVLDSTFEGSTATSHGGGLVTGYSGNYMLRGCAFEGNSAVEAGGGVYTYSSLHVVDCSFTGNSADRGGGACAAGNSATSSYIGCTFSGNSVTTRGAALYAVNGGGRVVNSVVHHNTGIAGAGAVTQSPSGRLEVLSSVVANNTVGGVRSMREDLRAIVSNSIVWGNAGGQLLELAPIVRFSNVQGGADGIGNMNANPLFVGALGGNYRLLSSSPCIDAGATWAVPSDSADLDGDGDTSELVPLDHDGNPRFADATGTDDTGCGFAAMVDMGAFESIGDPGPSVEPGDVNGDGTVDVADLLVLLAAWGPCMDECCLADLDLNGAIDVADLLIVLAHWG